MRLGVRRPVRRFVRRFVRHAAGRDAHARRRRSGPFRRLRTQPRLEHHDALVGRQVELLSEQRRVHARVAERGSDVTGRGQRRHQPSGDARAQWILRCERAPPRQRRRGVAASRRLGGQAIERLRVRARQHAALVIKPLLERFGGRQPDSVE